MASCADAADDVLFYMAIETFSCKSYNRETRNFDTSMIIQDTSGFRYGYTCFNVSYQLQRKETLNQCSDFLIVGFRGDFRTEATQVVLTWTLNVTRDCNYKPA